MKRLIAILCLLGFLPTVVCAITWSLAAPTDCPAGQYVYGKESGTWKCRADLSYNATYDAYVTANISNSTTYWDDITSQTSISITESQISDLAHTTDTNASTACSSSELLDGDGNCITIASINITWSNSTFNQTYDDFVTANVSNSTTYWDGITSQSSISITESQVSDADWWDANADLSTDEISEIKIDFDTSCASGNHLYVSGNNLACEADDDTPDTDAEVPNAITVSGAVWVNSTTGFDLSDDVKFYLGTDDDVFIMFNSTAGAGQLG